jgi:O-antigen/teichoic acid export membrane protein
MFASWLIPTIFGSEYNESVLPFMILIFECIISGLGWLLSQRFNASGRPGLVLVRQLVSIIPLIYIYFYQFEFNILLTISLALLSSSIIRLIITMVFYQKVFHEQAPRLYPTKGELKSIYQTIKKGNHKT